MLFDHLVSRLRTALGRPGPAVISAEGRLGLSPLPFVLRATRGRRRVVFAPPALTDDANRRALAAKLGWAGGSAGTGRLGSGRRRGQERSTGGRLDGHSGGPRGGWAGLLEALPSMAPVVLVVDDPQGITAVHRRFWHDLGAAWRLVRRSGQRVHLVLCSCERGLGRELNRPASPLRRPAARLAAEPDPDPVTVVSVEPGTHYDLATAFPRWQGRDLLLGWALFGGLPSTWRAVPKRLAPEAALRRVLGGGARGSNGDGDAGGRWTAGDRWTHGPWELLQQGVGKPNRYASVLCATAKGARSWREVSEPAFQSSGNRSGVGPYLARLRELGLIAADRPLGAGASGRRTRYRLTDPHEAFWWSTVHPARSELLVPGQAATVWEKQVAPALDAVLARALPTICLNFLRFGSGLVLGATAREAAPLWGPGFDFPAAAALHNGAVCYGHVHQGPEPASTASLAKLERQVRKTRYGFARQARVRIVFSLAGFDQHLRREAARNALVRLVGVDDLAQGAISAAGDAER